MRAEIWMRECSRDGQGMTLRDYFAAKAMQSMLDMGSLAKTTGQAADLWACAPARAYEMADAMLAARSAK